MVTFLAVLLMMYTFRNLLGLLATAIIFNFGLKTLSGEGLSEQEFYGDLVYKFKKLIERIDHSFQFRKIITRYSRIGYNLTVMRQSA